MGAGGWGNPSGYKPIIDLSGGGTLSGFAVSGERCPAFMAGCTILSNNVWQDSYLLQANGDWQYCCSKLISGGVEFTPAAGAAGFLAGLGAGGIRLPGGALPPVQLQSTTQQAGQLRQLWSATQRQFKALGQSINAADKNGAVWAKILNAMVGGEAEEKAQPALTTDKGVKTPDPASGGDLDPADKGGDFERGPKFWTGKLMIFNQLVRSKHETYSPSYLHSRVQD
jgi:hypothetical protein